MKSGIKDLKFFALIALSLTVLSGVYPLQFRGVDGDKDAGTGSGEPKPNLCTLYEGIPKIRFFKLN